MASTSRIRILARASTAIFFVVYFALAVHSEYWLGVVTTHPIGDDFKIYYGAYQKALTGQNPYEPYGIGSGFIYHPSALTLVSLIAWFGDQRVSTYLWIAISAAAWGVSIWLAIRLAEAAWACECRISDKPRISRWFVVLVFLGFAPFWETLHIGQVNAFVVLCTLLAIHWSQRRPLAAGLALALAVVLKTSPLVLAAYFGAMRRFRLVASAIAGLLVLSWISSVQFSPQVFNQFWTILPRLGSEVHPDTYNQSFLSVLYQTFSSLSQGNSDATLVLGYRLAFLGVSTALLAIGLFVHLKSGQLSIWLYMAVIAATVFFSPLVWYHHSTLLLLPLSALILNPGRIGLGVGLGLVFLLQAERAFEQFETLTAYPIVVVHLVLIGMLVTLYLKCNGRFLHNSGDRSLDSPLT